MTNIIVAFYYYADSKPTDTKSTATLMWGILEFFDIENPSSSSLLKMSLAPAS